jgi:hypothetical protein
VGVVHSEPAQQHFGIAIGYVVSIQVGVEQQIGRLGNKHAAVSDGHSGGEIQVGEKVFDGVRASVSVGVFVDRNPVVALRPLRRWIGKLVVLGSQPVINFDRLQAVRIRELPVLKHPHPAAVIETNRQRLTHLRLSGDQLDL